MATAIAPKKIPGKDQELIRNLWDAFLVNYFAFRTRKIVPADNMKFRLISSPGPLQYSAFVQFFGHFEKEEDTIWEDNDNMYMHDLANMEKSNPAILEFLQNLYSPDSCYNVSGKKITMASGSFWGEHIQTREKIIEQFKELRKNNAKVRVVSQAREEEEHIEDLTPYLESDYCFDLTRRIPIHFTIAGEDYLFFEFPHTESTVFRLNMFMDLNNLKLKQGKTKADVLNFLEALIEGAI
jgi:hypothetical protein